MTLDKDIAVVGMACVFPRAANVRQFWSNLANGVDAIDSPPPGRWSDRKNFQLAPEHEAFLPSNRGGFLPTGMLFNPVPFGVLPNLPRHGDPDQFVMLHVIDAALRDARVAEDSPLRKRTDVLIGRGGYPTGKLVEVTLRAEAFEAVLELLGRRYPDLVGPRRREMEEYLRSTLTPLAADNVSTAIANITASRAANRLNLRGAAFTVDGACASSLLAVEQAVWRLRTRQCDLAVAAGVFLSLSPTFLYAFASIGALSPSGMMRPFDRRADGLLAGEGGGAVILKRLADAVRDGDPVYAIVKGVGSSSDGRELDVLAPSSAGQVLALENAYADAALDRDRIGYLELHGTGTVAGDLAELATIKTFFGAVREPVTARAMGSVKSMIGHCMPAAGIASFIKTALTLSNKILPPSLNCEQPRPELADAPFYLNTQTRPWIHNPSHGPRRAGVNAFGFGGINAHVILEEVPASLPSLPKSQRGRGSEGAALPLTPCPSPRGGGREERAMPRPIETGLRRPSELLVFSAESDAELREQLLRLDHFLKHDQTEATPADLAWTLSRTVQAHHPVKLALICDDLSHLRRLLDRCFAANPLGDFEDMEEIYYSREARTPPGKIAFIFPGMGFPGLIGNYPDHLMELCLHYPEVRAEFDFFEDRDRHPDDTVPTSAIFSPPPVLPEEYRRRLKARLAPPQADQYQDTAPAAHERYLAAMGVTLSNWASWVLLRKFAIPVEMLTGQSQGEMAALCAAGIADFHAIAPSFWKVLNVDARDAAGRRLLFAWTSAEQVAPLLAEEPDAHPAIYMAPTAIVLGGGRESLLRIADKLRDQEILVQMLPYPPIHTPCLTHLRGELLEQLSEEKVHFRKPAVSFYSSITGACYPDDEAGIRETLMMNVDRPLRVWQTVQRMYDDGARIFVQVGGGRMATHVQAVLPAGAEVVSVALDNDMRNPLTQLNHLCARLFCCGVPMTLDPLFDHRTVRTLDPDRPQPAPAPSRFAVPLRIDWSPVQQQNTKDQEEAARPAPQPAARFELPEEARRMPVLGQVTSFVPEQEIVIDRTLDLEEDLFLHDHLFVNAECKPLEERLPILPLTMSLELAAEAAALLSPGLGLIGFENVRGIRWIGLRDCSRTDLRIEARVEGVEAETGVQRVRCTIFFENQPSFSTVVLFAEAYRRDIPESIAASSNDGPWPISVEQVYGERFNFHGPRFQTVDALHTLGNPMGSGALRAMPRDDLFASNPEPLLLTDPCLMDGVGQFVGLWARMYQHFILPISVDKIEFYGPPPPVGTICPIRVEVVRCDTDIRQICTNLELEDGSGTVCARFQGWSDWLLNWPEIYEHTQRQPHLQFVSEELDLPGLPAGSVCMLIRRECFSGVDLEWAARLFLHSREMPRFWEATGSARRQLLLSRAAVKDAVRVWRARLHGTELPHPAEFAIEHDELGRPYLLHGDGPSLPHISIAHTSGGAIAIASPAPVGVDLEQVGRDTSIILDQFTTHRERELLEQLSAQAAEANWSTRLWCAKEAAGKALGIGLAGRPRDLEMLEYEEDGSFLIQHAPTGERVVVLSADLDSFLLAWAARTGAISSPHGAAEEVPGVMQLTNP